MSWWRIGDKWQSNCETKADADLREQKKVRTQPWLIAERHLKPQEGNGTKKWRQETIQLRDEGGRQAQKARKDACTALTDSRQWHNPQEGKWRQSADKGDEPLKTCGHEWQRKGPRRGNNVTCDGSSWSRTCWLEIPALLALWRLSSRTIQSRRQRYQHPGQTDR